jgi:CsoR family transcriptional regulator, copper-sensing transcriptional repressor
MGGILVNYPMGVYLEDSVLKKAGAALKRVEGQVRGVQKMVEEDRYCIDIVTQIEAVRAALAKVESDLLRRHMQHCVHKAMTSKNAAEQEKVIEELVGVFRKQS